MNKTFEQGKEEIARLCRYFATNRQAFTAAGVKEADIRQSLIDPLFEALGWDVRNTAMVAPQYREVIPEPSLDVEGQQKAPDYTFRVGPLPKFYAEAKKCGVNIHADPAPAHQLRRYGWSAKVAVSVLTDFEELAVYDCTLRPRENDKASHARILYFQYEEYPERWRELWDVFSREAVWSGAFDQYAASKRKRGTSEVDLEFLKELEGWRVELARNIALRNKDLSSDDLNAAVQLTIDRVVFLRMAEDRGLEPEQQLLKLCERPEIYGRFMRDVCRRADEKYNSGLFHFQKESGVAEPPDRITPRLAVDDRVFKSVLQSLYFAHGSPYHFGVMPVEILGTVYERFLGKVIRLTAGHQAKIEEKPAVAKAGGVYYTPAYIVDYIVGETIGRQVEGRSPAQLAGLRNGKQPFRVLDMACGSGSFLLGAYQRLLDHCLGWYIDNKPSAHKQAVYQDPRGGAWRLTIGEKKRILTTHLFGVDIDAQAVEVSKLSLLLKALEGENDTTLSLQLRLFHDRALPNLAENIKCGNSLIGPDYFSGKLLPDHDELKRVNPFDWRAAFPDAMRSGGFDCVIGNPPYVRIQTMKEWAPLEVEVFKEVFRSASTGNYDIYVVFIEQGLNLLNAKGRLGFICPHKFFNSKYGEPVRRLIAEGKHLSHAVHFGDQQVFDRATTYTCLLFLDKSPASKCRFVKVDDLAAWRTAQTGAMAAIKAAQITASEWNFTVGPGAALLATLSRMPLKLRDVARLFVGLQTDDDDVFIVEEIERQGRRVRCRSEATEKEHWFEDDHLKPFLKGSLNIRRYRLTDATKRLIFPYETHEGKSVLISPGDYERRYPLTWTYLEENRERLASRNKGRMGREWYGYVYKKNHTRFGLPKILAPSLAKGSCFAADFEGRYFFVGSGGGGGGGYGIVPHEGGGYSLQYLLGILNSKLLSFAIHAQSTPYRGGYVALNRQYIEQLPIAPLDLTSAAGHEIQLRMARLVEAMLSLHRQFADAKAGSRQEIVQRQIASTDAQIDRLVYELYRLTRAEVAIVEEQVAT